jgi:hypothetical protein
LTPFLPVMGIALELGRLTPFLPVVLDVQVLENLSSTD